MPRSSSSNTSRSRPYSSALQWRPSNTYSSPKSPVPPIRPPPVAPTTPTLPVQNHVHHVERPGFFSNLWQGFGLGAGQSIAFNMFRSDPVVKHVHETTPSVVSKTPSADSLPNEYVQCMKESQNNAEACKQYLEQVETKFK